MSESLRDPHKDDLLDFPECDGILTALDNARGADERAVAREVGRFRREGLARLEQEVTAACWEFAPPDDKRALPRVVARSHAPGFLDEPEVATAPRSPAAAAVPDAWPAARRDTERERLWALHARAARACANVEERSLAPLLVQAREIRKYFACADSESLDAIYATLRDFLRALCDSRDVQRRGRRAARREADRRAAARARRRSAADLRASLETTPCANVPPTEPRPPPGPPEDLPRIDQVLARARRQRAAVDGNDDSHGDSRDFPWNDDLR